MELLSFSLRGLTRLEVPVSRIQAAGMAVVSRYLTQLVHLNVNANQIGDGGVACFTALKRLRVLNLRENGITTAAVATLSQLTSLVDLTVDVECLGEEGKAVLRHSLKRVCL
jgi:hypothetical protein